MRLGDPGVPAGVLPLCWGPRTGGPGPGGAECVPLAKGLWAPVLCPRVQAAETAEGLTVLWGRQTRVSRSQSRGIKGLNDPP